MSLFDLFQPKYDIKVDEFGNLLKEEDDSSLHFSGENYKLYSALDLARYIIVNFSYGSAHSMTVERTQFLLYFCQIYALLRRDKCPLFLEKMYAYNGKVVIMNVENEYKGVKYKNPDDLRICAKKYLSIDNGRVCWKKFNSGFVERKDRKIIKDVVEAFDEYSTSWMGRIIKSQTPYRTSLEEESGDHEILLEDLFDYFYENPEEAKLERGGSIDD